MKGVTIIVIILAAALLWFAFGNQADAPATEEETTTEESMEETSHEDGAVEESGDAMEESSEGGVMEEDGETVEESGEVMEEDGESSEGEAMEEGDVETKVFDVEGVNFAFDVEEIRVKEGETVTVNFKSTDGFHDWVVDEFDAATARVQTGGETSVTFVASAKGEYEYYCSVGNHRAQGMVGTLIVE